MSDQGKRLMFFLNSINAYRELGEKILRQRVTNYFAGDEVF